MIKKRKTPLPPSSALPSPFIPFQKKPPLPAPLLCLGHLAPTLSPAPSLSIEPTPTLPCTTPPPPPRLPNLSKEPPPLPSLSLLFLPTFSIEPKFRSLLAPYLPSSSCTSPPSPFQPCLRPFSFLSLPLRSLPCLRPPPQAGGRGD